MTERPSEATVKASGQPAQLMRIATVESRPGGACRLHRGPCQGRSRFYSFSRDWQPSGNHDRQLAQSRSRSQRRARGRHHHS